MKTKIFECRPEKCANRCRLEFAPYPRNMALPSRCVMSLNELCRWLQVGTKNENGEEKNMDFSEYQKRAFNTATAESRSPFYMTLGLAGEAGEIANKVKKVIRDGKEIDREDLEKELGDVLWYLSGLATVSGISLEEVAKRNLEKLADRALRGVIKGSGDNR